MRLRTFSLFFTALAMLSVSVVADAQNAARLAGRWEGALPPKDGGSRSHELGRQPAAPRPMLVIIAPASDGTYSGQLISVGQKGLAVGEIAIDGETVRISASKWKGSFEGKLGADGVTLDGEWRQGGRTTPLVLRRTGEADDRGVGITESSPGVVTRR